MDPDGPSGLPLLTIHCPRKMTRLAVDKYKPQNLEFGIYSYSTTLSIDILDFFWTGLRLELWTRAYKK